MAYDVTLVQVNAVIGGYDTTGVDFGFPSGFFDTILMSMWTCLPNSRIGGSDIGPSFLPFFGFGANGGGCDIHLVNENQEFYTASFTSSPISVRSNHLISVNCHTQTVQYYCNDAAQTQISGGWIIPAEFKLSRFGLNSWDFNVGSQFGFVFPAIADFWMGATTGFVDLSIEANRRKFINADLSPVDLGSTGANPFGSSPQIFQTVPPAGVPNDYLINRGSGGGAFHTNSGTFLTFQTAGTCTLPNPVIVNVNINITGLEADFAITAPSITLGAGNLVLTDVEITATSPIIHDNEVTLRWSDDAGASWSNGLLRSMGEAGEYFTSPTWYRLGMSRSRIIELSWSGAQAEALQGVFVEVTIAAT